MKNSEEQLDWVEILEEDEVENKVLLCNKLETPDGTVLESYYGHDYKSHKDFITGETYFVDGGLSYARGSYNGNGVKNQCVYSTSPHEVIRSNFKWGTYGKNGDKPLERVLLKDLSNLHIEAILKTQCHTIEDILKCLKDELEYRIKEGLYIEDKE